MDKNNTINSINSLINCLIGMYLNIANTITNMRINIFITASTDYQLVFILRLIKSTKRSNSYKL